MAIYSRIAPLLSPLFLPLALSPLLSTRETTRIPDLAESNIWPIRLYSGAFSRTDKVMLIEKRAEGHERETENSVCV